MGAMLPPDQAGRVKRLQAQGYNVAMAGNGINTTPTLAQADAGIAMGTGTDVTMASADMTLVRGELRGLRSAAPAHVRGRGHTARIWSVCGPAATTVTDRYIIGS